MSTEARSPGKKDATSVTKSPENNKGKGKTKSDLVADVSMEEDEDEDEEDDEDDEEGDEQMEEDEEEEEEEYEEIDPSAIVSRRTRGVRVDYTSEEALKKAGMTKEDIEKDDEEEGMKH